MQSTHLVHSKDYIRRYTHGGCKNEVEITCERYNVSHFKSFEKFKTTLVNMILKVAWEKTKAKVSGEAKEKAKRKAAIEAERLKKRIIQACEEVYEMFFEKVFDRIRDPLVKKPAAAIERNIMREESDT